VAEEHGVLERVQTQRGGVVRVALADEGDPRLTLGGRPAARRDELVGDARRLDGEQAREAATITSPARW